MKKHIIYMLVLTGILSFIASAAIANASEVSIRELSRQEIELIGEMIFKNECASKDDNLIAWNEGEDFMSLGIGHFIWYPAKSRKPFIGSFAKFIEYAIISGEKIPTRLDKKPIPACPWWLRDSFLNAQSDRRLIELKEFLIKTKSIQAAFIMKRLEEALPLILKYVSEGSREKVAFQMNRLISTPSGVYVLADYTNFKGLGITPSEYCRGKGWGLLQVLEGMRDKNEAPDAVREFVRSANIVLEDRVQNSPLSRNEKRWLPGWQKRVNAYIKQEEKLSSQE